MPPRVLVDATAVPADRGGVGRYVDSLLEALARAGAEPAVVCQATDVERYRGLPGTVDVLPAPAAIVRRPVRLAWEQAGLPALVRRSGADVLHSPHYTLPAAAGRPVVVTLHDATFFSDPHLHGRVKGAFFRGATRVAVRRAAACVVPSRATRSEVVRLTGADPAAFHVAYHGVDADVFRQPSPEEVVRVAASLGLTGRSWVAFLGTLEPRKNVPALVRGFVEACRDRLEPPALVLAGARGWDGDVDRAVAEVPDGLTVLRPGYLPLEDLRALLGGALVVAYPSLGEGFGLPVLEAMACAAPVLTTRRLSLPEVGGDAVAYCEPDVRSVADALAELLDDAPRRAQLATAAQARAAGFTWDRCAEEHLAAYEAAASR